MLVESCGQNQQVGKGPRMGCPELSCVFATTEVVLVLILCGRAENVVRGPVPDGIEGTVDTAEIVAVSDAGVGSLVAAAAGSPEFDETSEVVIAMLESPGTIVPDSVNELRLSELLKADAVELVVP